MASRSVNKVILLGNLGKDSETKFTPGGAAKTTFTVATSRRWKDQQSGEWKDETDWHNIILWKSENLANYLLKGKQVYVEGRIQTRSWEDKDGQKRYTTEVVAAVPMNTRRRRRFRCRAVRSARRLPRLRRNRMSTAARGLRTTTFLSDSGGKTGYIT